MQIEILSNLYAHQEKIMSYRVPSTPLFECYIVYSYRSSNNKSQQVFEINKRDKI